MANGAKSWEDLDLTRDEVENMAKALKDDTFKKMLFDYCEEMQSPENRRIFQEEMTQLEAERGVHITFINPEPGFVVKTSVDGSTKCFLNIAKSDKVERPKSTPQLDSTTGKRGLLWSIPLSQTPPRKDLDKKGSGCVVYDVVFHPDALRMSERNAAFRTHLIQTACDAVEREHKVKLDRINLKFPKMAFKGIAQPTVIRKMAEKVSSSCQEPSPLDQHLPPLPKDVPKPKVFTSNSSKTKNNVDNFATPQFVIKHRHSVDYSQMTHELDAKLNVTIPKELVVEISLPLLNSTSECNLDVTDKSLYLVSTQPAKYKLKIDLPYPVNDKEGSAKFIKTTRKLVVTLPVLGLEKERTIRDLYREDSGVESDVRDDSGNVSPSPEDDESLVIELTSPVTPEQLDANTNSAVQCPFLDSNIEYNLPPNFDCNTLDDVLAFTLHVKNVQPDSVQHTKGEQWLHVKFSTLGAGFYPVHYAFFIQLPPTSRATVRSVDAEPWDNNLILSVALDNCEGLKTYMVGSNTDDLKEHTITEDFVIKTNRNLNLLQEKNELNVSVKPLPETNHIEIEIKSSQDGLNESDQIVSEDCKQATTTKKPKRKNKKRRSYSESACEDFKPIEIVSTTSATKSIPISNDSNVRKGRSLSESREANSVASSTHKGILKHRSRYERSSSESYSSYDDHSSFSCSVDLGGPGSFDNIPEEENEESCKKTVRFSDVIKKQLFRLDSSILGQRKKNQRKKMLRARHRSEGDSQDYDDKSSGEESMTRKNPSKVRRHDSGLDLSSEDKAVSESNEHLDHDVNKSGLMFDMEI